MAPDENALAEAAEGHPHDGSLWFNLGVVRAQKGEVAPAISAFQRSLPLLSDKLPAYSNIIALDLTAHDAAAALPPCREALTLYSTDLELMQNCAYALTSESKFLEAIGPLRSLKHARPNDLTVRVALISALRGANQIMESRAELKELFATSLLSRDQAEALAHDFARVNAASEAQETYAYVAKIWPAPARSQAVAPASERDRNSAQAISASAELSAAIAQATGMIREERYVDAIHFLDQTRGQFPDQPALEYDAALADVCLQRFTEAVTILKKIKQRSPDSARVDFLLGGSYEIQGNEADAESSYREAAMLEPDHFIYHRVLGALLQKEGRFTESSAVLQRALNLQPDDSLALILFARVLEKQGAIQQAMSALEHAVRSDPNSRRAHSELAALYFRQKRTADAEQQQAAAAKLEDQRIQQWTIWGTAPRESN